MELYASNLLKAKYGANYSPPAASHYFADMNGHWAEAFADQAYREGITSGCSTNPRNFCPTGTITRDMNAVFIENTFHLVQPPPAFSYSGTWRKYYFAGASRVAMRNCAGGGGAACSVPTFFLSDHLGSTSLGVALNGDKTSQIMYKPWGEVRYSWTASTSLPTQYTFTGQYSYMDDLTTSGVTEGFGLMFYNARWYDPYLNHFTQPDTIVPDPYNSQSYDRYAYALNNPLRYTDPTGHSVDCGMSDAFCSAGKYKPGGLISLYRHYFGDDAVRMRDSKDRKRLSTEIEDYMESNPDYDPFKDSYLPDPSKRKGEYFNFMVFKGVREDYWLHRLMDETGTWDPGEIGRLMAYYDFHKQDITITEWDASGVDWFGTGLDGASFTAAVVALFVAPEYAVWANATSVGFGIWSGGRSVLKGDYVGGGLSVGGFRKPPFGTFLSGVSIIRDLSAGFYTIPYIPSFER